MLKSMMTYIAEYKPLIEQAPNATYVKYLAGLLRKSGWPESLIKDKIIAYKLATAKKY
jgi:hypothetical protein